MTDTTPEILEAVARAICGADTTAQDPDAPIYSGMKSCSAWEGRADMAQAAIDAYLKAISEAEAEARIPRTLKDCGYAPGSYMNKCRGACGKTHIADKRAWRCLECATAMLKAGETP